MAELSSGQRNCFVPLQVEVTLPTANGETQRGECLRCLADAAALHAAGAQLVMSCSGGRRLLGPL